jgi:hypothetical protein
VKLVARKHVIDKVTCAEGGPETGERRGKKKSKEGKHIRPCELNL